MDYFLKCYKERCKKEFSCYGFKSYRNNHYRVVNDVFQSFNLHRSIYGRSATVEFVIKPLSVFSDINKTSCGSCSLKEFEGIYSWFVYDRYSEESINQCIEEMINYMHKYLIPFFENGCDCKKAYKAVCDFEKMANVSDGVLHLTDKIFMTLKTKEYHLTKFWIQQQISHHLYAYKKNEVHGVMTPELKRRINTDVEKLTELYERVDANDEKYLDNLIRSNEERNLNNLKIKNC